MVFRGTPHAPSRGGGGHLAEPDLERSDLNHESGP